MTPAGYNEGHPEVSVSRSPADWLRHAQQLLEHGQYRHAVDAADRAPRGSRALSLRAFANERLGDLDAALADTEAALDLAPDATRLRVRAAELCHRVGRFHDGLRHTEHRDS